MTTQLKDSIILLVLWFGFVSVCVWVFVYFVFVVCFFFNLTTSISDLNQVLF